MYILNDYCSDYWLNSNIIDCGEIIINNNSTSIDINETKINYLI